MKITLTICILLSLITLVLIGVNDRSDSALGPTETANVEAPSTKPATLLDAPAERPVARNETLDEILVDDADLELVDPEEPDERRPATAGPPNINEEFLELLSSDMGRYTLPKINIELLNNVQNVGNFRTLTLQIASSATPPDGPYTSEHEDGTPKEQGQYHRGRKVGLWTTWHPNGERESHGRYVHGAKHGFWTFWHATGETKSEGEFLYDRREGPWTGYYESGAVLENENYVNDHVDGSVKRFHESGQAREVGFYSFGSAELAWRTWHENGKLATRGTYENGKRVGGWEYFDEEGVRDDERSGIYVNDEKVPD